MKNRRRYIILLIILAIYVIIMYFIFGAPNVKKSKYTTTILIGDNTIWNYSNKKWLNIEDKEIIEELNWKKYTVYINNQKKGKYYLWHDDKWYLFNKNKEAVNVTGKLVAYRSNFDINVKDFKEEQITDYVYINKVLEENNLSTSQQYTTKSKTSIDIDSDGIYEDIYVISNVFALDFTPEINFAIVFMVKNDNIYYIYNDIDQNKGTNGCKPYLNTFLDIDSDKTYEIVLSCGKYSTQEPVDMLYKFESDKFKILISNQ